MDSVDPEDVDAVLAAYSLALQQEYETNLATQPENIAEYTKDFFQKNVHTSAAQIAFLALHAESETVRLNAAKFIIMQAFADEEKEQDPLKALLTSLNPAKTVN